MNRLFHDHEELVERITRYADAVGKKSWGGNQTPDYAEGYKDALLDTLDLLTGNVGMPLQQDRRQ